MSERNTDGAVGSAPCESGTAIESAVRGGKAIDASAQAPMTVADANAAAQLSITNAGRSLGEMLNTLGKKFSGDALYREVIEEAKDMVCKFRTVVEQGGCFAAGTLVHTKDGLKPIEEIKVGDWVLSQPEDRGEVAYKRVVRAFSFEDKAVVRVRFSVRRGEEWVRGDAFIVTGNHPFWVAGKERSWFAEDLSWEGMETNLGWIRADLLSYGDILLLSSGEHAVVTSSCSVEKLWRTKQENVAWEAKAGDETGRLVTIHDGSRVEFHTDRVMNEDLLEDDTFRYRDERPEWREKWYYSCKVYNFEVEDFHTYYVGNFGVWVHNANCYRATVEPCSLVGRVIDPR